MSERKNWATAQMNEWYLFPETLPASPNPSGYSSLWEYVDSLTAMARAQGRDRYFTYVTSIREEEAYYQSGSTAAFGFRLQIDTVARRLFVTEVYENTPAALAGFRRGSEILAIGSSGSDLRTVASLIDSDGEAGIWQALGASDAGLARAIRHVTNGDTATPMVTKREFDLPPVPQDNGVRVLEEDGRKIGYLNLRTFISTADPALRNAFRRFRAEGIDHVIIDLRYNGGGLIRTAELLGDLLGGGRNGTDVQSYTAFRPSKSQYDETRRFQLQPESISPAKLAFIVTGDSASASEMVINAMTPWLRENSAIIGSNTYGKPVGQIARDRAACDDRLRIIALQIQNADRRGDYFDGLAGRTGASCRAEDDLSHAMGSAQEASTRTAIDFLMGRSCTPVAAGSRAMSADTAQRALLVPKRPTTAQREAPGTF